MQIASKNILNGVRYCTTTHIGMSKQAANMRRLMRGISSSAHSSTNLLREKAMRLINESLLSKDWLLADQVAQQTNIDNLEITNLHSLSESIRQSINNRSIQTNDLISITSMLRNYNYEPNQTDDSTFLQLLQSVSKQGIEYSAQLLEQLSLARQQCSFIIDLTSMEGYCRALATSPQAKNNKPFADRYYRLIKNGIVLGVWSNELKNDRYYEAAFATNVAHSNLKRLVDFDLCRRPEDCQIDYRKEQTPPASNTEAKISRYLKEAGYKFIGGPKLSGFEIDFLIANRTILEYNGLNHYCINSPKRLTRYFEWKYNRLRKIGFDVVLIDGREWEMLERRQKQMEMLVASVETPTVNRIGKQQ